jgi:chaperonin cofactor prefoldin
MPKQKPLSSTKKTHGLAKALKENKDATQAVEKAADDLAVVHAVLDSELPKEIVSSDVDRAVEQTSELEKQLSASSEKLKKVNESLERELTNDNA